QGSACSGGSRGSIPQRLEGQRLNQTRPGIGSAQNRYRARLQAEAQGRNGEGKRARTRARLKLATLNLLARIGYRGITTTGIAKEAGVAVGTFYTHFADRRDVLLEVMSEFLEGEVR